MNKTKKQNIKNRNKRSKNISVKNNSRDKIHVLTNNTSKNITKISKDIDNYFENNKFNAKGIMTNNSYSPTINEELVTLKSISRNPLFDCNNKEAFLLNEPLKIGIPGYIYGNNCFVYNSPQAKKYLLRNLEANKHIDPKKIIPPVQSMSNCWFNTMFVTFFISDKGRKFFHFFRQLMIEGKQKNGKAIPEKLRDAFALLNFSIDSCLTGNDYAYEMNTNSIIRQIFTSIPSNYKAKYPLIVDIDAAGNPIIYYASIINYLNNNSIGTLFMREVSSNWKDQVMSNIKKMRHLPHIVILEIFEKHALVFNKKPITFTINNAKYKLDSTVVRDISKQHFCATITCENKEYAYDGASFTRLTSLEWKNKLNSSNFTWKFEGTSNHDGSPLEWNFTKCYQLLIYYRIN
jgi:hypothetical protein